MSENDSDEAVGATAERQMLLAMRALDHKIQVTSARLTQVKKGWADQLKEVTQTLNETIRSPIPSDGCDVVLARIQECDKKRQNLEADKSSEISKLKQVIAEAESAFYEILRRRANPNQQNLNFGTDVPDKFDPRAGILLSRDHLDVVRDATSSFMDDTDGEIDGLDELSSRLDELGVADIGFPADIDDEVDDGDGDDE